MPAASPPLTKSHALPAYFVNEPNCEIYSTYSPSTSDFRKLEPIRCLPTHPGTSVSQIKYNRNRTVAYLVLYRHRLAHYSIEGRVDCHFQYVLLTDKLQVLLLLLLRRRLIDDQFPFFPFKYSQPEPIQRKVTLLAGNRVVYVSCKDFITKQIVYKNAHSTMLVTDEGVQAKLRASQQTPSHHPKFGLLLILFDSMSSSSFYRALPQATDYLLRTGWFSLRGHHKVQLNTYPNMNVVLGGQVAQSDEDERRIWTDFQANEYVTMYAEDMASETFAWYAGRSDYESHPEMAVLEQGLPPKLHVNYNICNGQYPVFERLMDRVLEFGRTFKGQRHFGLFFNTAYTHDDISGPSMLDEPLLKYLKAMDRLGLRNDSLVVLFGDHGLRFGPERMSVEGGREDAMPVLLVSLPERLTAQHPAIVKALEVNRHRLTSHYDLHLTLKHIVRLNGGTPSYERLRSCPTCQSLFREVPPNRTCAQAGIPPGYCHCNVNRLVNAPDHVADYHVATQTVVDYMNGQLRASGHRCRQIKRPRIEYAWKSNGVVVSVFRTSLPVRVFEAAVSLENATNPVVLKEPLLLNQRSVFKRCGAENVRDYCHCGASKGRGSGLYLAILIVGKINCHLRG